MSTTASLGALNENNVFKEDQWHTRLSPPMPLFCSCNILTLSVIAKEQAERRREVCKAASLMPREVLQQAEKFSILLWKV